MEMRKIDEWYIEAFGTLCSSSEKTIAIQH